MSAITSIEWTDRTWGPTRGCSRVSAGCDNCYAMHMAHRFNFQGGAYEGLTRIGKRGVDWNGNVRLIPDQLDEPLRWRKPQRVFVNSMSDLFHEALPDEAIAQVFAVMLLAPRHTFQILTKRPERMLRFLTDYSSQSNTYGRILRHADVIRAERPADRLGDVGIANPALSPAPWIWLGVSVEDQATADERIPLLLQTPAAVRFVSYEPALGPVDFTRWMCAEGHDPSLDCRDHEPDGGLDWIIVGGESGPGARPFDVEWARFTVRQCKAAGVPVFVKQLGALPFDGYLSDVDLVEGGKGRRRPSDQVLSPEAARAIVGSLRVERWLKASNRKGGDPAEWPEDIRVREFPCA